MKVTMGKVELQMGGRYLTELRSSNEILNDTEALRNRLKEDGYLLIRDFHNREDVLSARRGILQKLQAMGRLDPHAPLEEGLIGPDNKSAMFGGAPAPENEDKLGPFYRLVNSSKVIDFFSELLGGEAMTYNYKWPRAVARGDFTGAHYDIVYMGRGTPNVYTMWTPLGDIPLELGPLAICLGSQHFHKIKETYGRMDVDRDNVEKGWFSENPIEIVENFGGQWATTPFAAGDVIIFGMFLMHASLDNVTNRYRLSADTRYQLRSEPVDERWIGRKPKGHYEWGKKPMVPIGEARTKWGV
jgi:hypothetical protein